MNNLELFNKCLENKEPVLDKNYFTKDPSYTNQVIKDNNKIFEILSNIKNSNLKNLSIQINEIKKILKSKENNLTFFVNFFPKLGYSYSAYSKLSDKEKNEFLAAIIPVFIKKRLNAFDKENIKTVIQIKLDAASHKQSGSLTDMKIEKILLKYEFVKYSRNNNIDFFSNERIFSKYDDELIYKLKKYHNLKFEWYDNQINKKADAIIKIGKKFFISEFKHKKEGGGGQNSQINELIEIIKYEEDNKKISYIAYLDGIYFNEFIDPSQNKIKNQLKKIKEYLKLNSNNYFVNTFGFRELIKNQISLID